jgi:hypothetical protein
MKSCTYVPWKRLIIYLVVGSPILHGSLVLTAEDTYKTLTLALGAHIGRAVDQQCYDENGQLFSVCGFQACAYYAAILSNWKA